MDGPDLDPWAAAHTWRMGGAGSGHRPAPVPPFVAPPQSLDAAPDPTVPAVSVLLVVLGTLALRQPRCRTARARCGPHPDGSVTEGRMS